MLAYQQSCADFWPEMCPLVPFVSNFSWPFGLLRTPGFRPRCVSPPLLDTNSFVSHGWGAGSLGDSALSPFFSQASSDVQADIHPHAPRPARVH